MPPYQPSYDGDEADGIAAAASPPAPELEPEHDDVAPNVCPDCGRTFGSKHALAVHRGRSHKLRPNGRPAIRPPATNGKAAPAAGRPAKVARSDVGDTLRELVGMFDRARELRDELAELEQKIAERQAQLAKAWTR